MQNIIQDIVGRTGLIGDLIEISMCDNQTIWINQHDRHFYKLMTYLEQKELFKK